MRTWWPLAVIVVAFVGWCVAFNAKTPYRTPGVLFNQRGPNRTPMPVPDVGAPDERQHANYVARLMNGEGFPVLKAGDYEGYQSHQPPLYYLMAAGWCKATGADPQAPEGGFRLRLLNTLIGVGTILAVYWTVRWGLGREEIALAASAFMLLPMVVGLHSAASNDPLLYLLSSWTLALSVLGTTKGWNWRLALGVGALVGLGLLTKTTALGLYPLVFVAVWMGRKVRKPLVWFCALVVPLLVASPWLMRNQALYGDPFAMGAFKAAFVNSPKAEAFIAMDGGLGYWTKWVGWWTARSFVGVFGQMDLFLLQRIDSLPPYDMNSVGSDLFYRLCVAGFGVLAAGWALAIRPLAKEGLETGYDGKAFNTLCGVLLGVVILLFVQFNLTYFQGQARYLFPAVAALAAGFGMGLWRLLGRYRKQAWVVMFGAMAVLDVVAFLAVVQGFALRTSM